MTFCDNFEGNISYKQNIHGRRLWSEGERLEQDFWADK
jgi:hypothetical protein